MYRIWLHFITFHDLFCRFYSLVQRDFQVIKCSSWIIFHHILEKGFNSLIHFQTQNKQEKPKKIYIVFVPIKHKWLLVYLVCVLIYHPFESYSGKEGKITILNICIEVLFGRRGFSQIKLSQFYWNSSSLSWEGELARLIYFKQPRVQAHLRGKLG